MFDNSQALDTLAAMPPEVKRKEAPGFWGALWSGMRAGGAEMFSDLSSLRIQRDADERTTGPIAEERARSRVANDRMAADSREFARSLRPDPATAGKAEEVVFQLSRALTKAGTTVGMAGPIAGGALFGASEGAATFDDLTRQGVDRDTALQAAGVSGVAGAVGVALPLMGSTVPRTLGLWAAGGPGGFIAQQAATSQILKRANYDEIAKQFDPLDPLGLALATLLPAPFAALGVARNLRAGRAVSPDVADAAMTHNLSLLRDQQEAQQAGGAAALPEVPPMPARPVPVDVPPPAPDFGRLSPAMVEARAAFDAMTASGKTTDAFLADARLTDEARNILLGMSEAAADPRRADALTRALVREGNAVDKLPTDATADAVESVRALTDEQLRGVEQAPPSGPDAHMQATRQRATQIADATPAMPVRMLDDGTVVTVADEMEAARRLAAEGSDTELGSMDANLLQVAAECALTFGE